jgi:hypothetical protein
MEDIMTNINFFRTAVISTIISIVFIFSSNLAYSNENEEANNKDQTQANAQTEKRYVREVAATAILLVAAKLAYDEFTVKTPKQEQEKSKEADVLDANKNQEQQLPKDPTNHQNNNLMAALLDTAPTTGDSASTLTNLAARGFVREPEEQAIIRTPDGDISAANTIANFLHLQHVIKQNESGATH